MKFNVYDLKEAIDTLAHNHTANMVMGAMNEDVEIKIDHNKIEMALLGESSICDQVVVVVDIVPDNKDSRVTING